jgi:hypothetical protein
MTATVGDVASRPRDSTSPTWKDRAVLHSLAGRAESLPQARQDWTAPAWLVHDNIELYVPRRTAPIRVVCANTQRNHEASFSIRHARRSPAR